MPHLPQPTLLAVAEKATQSGLVNRREELLSGLSILYVAGLPVANNPAAQLLRDLNEMNQLEGKIIGGVVPLETWLRNAVYLTAAFPDEQRFFRELADEVAGSTPPDRPPNVPTLTDLPEKVLSVVRVPVPPVDNQSTAGIVSTEHGSGPKVPRDIKNAGDSESPAIPLPRSTHPSRLITRRRAGVAILGTFATGAVILVNSVVPTSSKPTLYISNAIAYAPLQLARLDGKLPSWRLVDDQHLDRKERRRVLAAGEVEFFAGPLDEFVVDIAQHMLFEIPPILLLVIAQSEGTDAIVARSSKFTLHDLVRPGVVVAAWPGGSSHYLMLYRLADAGLDPKRMNFVGVNNAPALVNGLTSNTYHIIATWSPWSEVAVRNGGHIITRGGGEKHGPPEKYSGILATKKDHIRRYDTALQELFRSWDGAVEQLRRHPGETASTLAPWFELSEKQTLNALQYVRFLTVEESLQAGPYRDLVDTVRKQAQFAGLNRSGMNPNLEIDSSVAGLYSRSVKRN